MTHGFRIARASGIGGALCAIVALAVSPHLWWLGILVGFAGGYVAFEFRDVLRAIPVAFKASDAAIGKFFSKRHPVLYPSLAVGVVCALFSSTVQRPGH
ncbi:MAG TPA: hypothetical protein VGB97_01600, partial [Candidatus Paceibacterota bacterium]